jgi:4-amino-4-deoxychorismate lyase
LVNDTGALGISLTTQHIASIRDYLVSEAFVDKLRTLNFQYSCVIKVLISRGEGGRGYLPPSADEQKVKIYLSLHPLPESFTRPLPQAQSLLVSDIKLAKQSCLAGLKHNNRLEQVLAKQWLAAHQSFHQTNFDDVLMLDTDNDVIEASAANVFFYDGEKWLTPILTHSGVNGVMRSFTIQNQRKLGILFEESKIKLDDISAFSSAFMCNALRGIVSIKSITSDMQQVDFDISYSDLLSTRLSELNRELSE